MKYYIGQVAKLTDLSAAGLRLYEREGILEASREDSSGYRYYDRLDITALLRARSYQKYGFHLQTAEKLLNTNSINYIRDSCSELCASLEKDIIYRQALLEHLKRTESLIQNIPKSLGKIDLVARPAMYRLNFMNEDRFTLNKTQCSLFRQWFSHAPFTFPSQRNSWAALMQNEDKTSFALALFEHDVERLGLQQLINEAEFHPSCFCLHTVIRVDENTPSNVFALQPLIDYVLSNAIQVTGDPLSEVIVSFNKKTNYTRYRQVWIPIQQKT